MLLCLGNILDIAFNNISSDIYRLLTMRKFLLPQLLIEFKVSRNCC